MSDTAVSLLTPPGTGAIATVEVRGPRAWELALALFTPAGQPLPKAPEVSRFWFGTLGSDEVVLAATAHDAIEVHCHGGRRVVRWMIEQFLANGCVEKERSPGPSGQGFELLQQAPTLRTASILLDQLNGAFAAEVRGILATTDEPPFTAINRIRRLAAIGSTVGRHLVEPWKVVVAGPPNVGKSSLVNALLGYQRSVVAEVAGTTRDAVSGRTAFDGWPVELIDTAGLRDAEGLEAEGIGQARMLVTGADVVLWVLDRTAPRAWFGDGRPFKESLGLPSDKVLHVVNKCDAAEGWSEEDALLAEHPPLVSARSGEGIPILVAQLVEMLVPTPPQPGEAVPYTPRLIECLTRAHVHAALSWGAAEAALREALTIAEADHVG